MRVSFELNGKAVELEVEPRMHLADCLREELRLTGTHWGCDTSNCGACVVWLDETPVKSCTVLAAMADGSQRAIEVHIFPESMRGTGEGHYDWDLKPNTKMTNANVEQTVAGVDGPILSVKYKDGEKKLMVTPETAVVTYVIGDKNDLKPGTKIFVGAGKKQADGTVQTPRVTYGKDGLTPPM